MTTLLAAALLPEVAHAIDAADVVMDAGPLFSGTTVGWAPNGFGSPVVTWDPSLARWHAVMEYQTTIVDADCPHGVWGLAWSTTSATDGASGWSTPVQILTPRQNGTYNSCVAAHPAALSVETTSSLLGVPVGQALNVYFKAESETTTTACTTPGANQQNCVYTGIGRARVSFLNTVLFGYYFTSTSVGGTPMIPLAGIPFGFQSPIRLTPPRVTVEPRTRSGG